MAQSINDLIRDQKLKIFETLIDMFLQTNELGHFDEDDNTEGNYFIMLYDIPKDEKVINRIKKDIEKITINFKLEIIPIAEQSVNISITEIGGF